MPNSREKIKQFFATEEAISRFCYDTPAFVSVYRSFQPEMRPLRKVQAIQKKAGGEDALATLLLNIPDASVTTASDVVSSDANRQTTSTTATTHGYYTYRLRITNDQRVQAEVRDQHSNTLAEPNGALRYQGPQQAELQQLVTAAYDQTLAKGDGVKALGEALFNTLFDDGLRQDFLTRYNQVVHAEGQMLRIELDVDEAQLPEIAALPWEFMRVPTSANMGTLWLSTAPKLIFSRRRAQWHVPQPIQLAVGEKLRIALVISAPDDLGPVAADRVQSGLEKLVQNVADQVELLPVVTQATPEKIDDVLELKPHILHFIGHGQLVEEGTKTVGKIALVDDIFDEAMWVEADYFSNLFGRHRPGVVLLQACEGGALSASQAFVGVASRIVQQNIPVVVAMQYEVSNTTATRFALRFYQRLAEGQPVDIAAQEGRYGVALGPAQYNSRDFATPVIFMRVRDGHLFSRNG